MLFGFGILITAVVLSLVAAYYSVAGLTAIFSAATIPVMIMGGTLELGKLMATVWLHNNWRRVPWVFKTYLIPAILFLMLLTSMGIFGYLSKAHSDQSLVTGDSQARVAIYDDKIKTARDNIEANRRALKQMDESVDQVMGRSTSETGADKAVAIRRGQQKERARLLAEISAEQKTISKLSEERAPLAAETRKIEAEVGPIKYIAALIYGDGASESMLEKAVRLVIIMIVLVFDPLALCLILAANKQFEWVREDREKALAKSAPEYEPDDGALTPDQLAQLQPMATPPVEPLVEKTHAAEPKPEPVEPVVQYHRVCPQCGIRVVNAPGIGPFCPNPDCGRGDDLTENPPTVSLLEEHPYVLQKFVHFANTQPLVAPLAQDAAVTDAVPPEETPAVTTTPVEPEEISVLDLEPVAEPEPQDLYEDLEIEQEIVSGIPETTESEPEDLYQDWSEQDLEQVAQDLLDTVDQQDLEQALEELKAEFEQLMADAEPEADTEESQETTPQPEPEPEQTEVDGDNDIINLTEDEVIKAAMRAWKADNPNDTLKHQRQLLAAGRIDRLPWMPMSELQLEADNEEPPAGVMRGFGAQFPVDANKGDSFMRVDQLPGRLYKHNGVRWIEVNRDLSDQYVYDTAYIDHLIAKIGSGEYDIELLTDSERDQISRRLLND
jgi:hypothetical protein